MGNAKKILAVEGYKIEMSIPTSIIGRGKKIKNNSSVIGIVIPFNCEFGQLFMELTYSEES